MAFLLISAGHTLPFFFFFLHFFCKGWRGGKKRFSEYTSGRSSSKHVWAGVSCLLWWWAETRCSQKADFYPSFLVSAQVLQQRCSGPWQAAPLWFLPPYDHTAWPQCVTLRHPSPTIFWNDVFPLREPLSYNSSLGLDFWLLLFGSRQGLILTGLAACLFPIQCAHLQVTSVSWGWALPLPGESQCFSDHRNYTWSLL